MQGRDRKTLGLMITSARSSDLKILGILLIVLLPPSCWCASIASRGPSAPQAVSRLALFPERPAWCQTQNITQIVSQTGCRSKTIANRVCLGQCYSYSVPNTLPQSSNALVHCDSCTPTDLTWEIVTLNCDGASPTASILVEMIIHCQCQACSRPPALHPSGHAVELDKFEEEDEEDGGFDLGPPFNGLDYSYTHHDSYYDSVADIEESRDKPDLVQLEEFPQQLMSLEDDTEIMTRDKVSGSLEQSFKPDVLTSRGDFRVEERRHRSDHRRNGRNRLRNKHRGHHESRHRLEIGSEERRQPGGKHKSELDGDYRSEAESEPEIAPENMPDSKMMSEPSTDLGGSFGSKLDSEQVSEPKSENKSKLGSIPKSDLGSRLGSEQKTEQRNTRGDEHRRELECDGQTSRPNSFTMPVQEIMKTVVHKGGELKQSEEETQVTPEKDREEQELAEKGEDEERFVQRGDVAQKQGHRQDGSPDLMKQEGKAPSRRVAESTGSEETSSIQSDERRAHGTSELNVKHKHGKHIAHDARDATDARRLHSASDIHQTPHLHSINSVDEGHHMQSAKTHGLPEENSTTETVSAREIHITKGVRHKHNALDWHRTNLTQHTSDLINVHITQEMAQHVTHDVNRTGDTQLPKGMQDPVVVSYGIESESLFTQGQAHNDSVHDLHRVEEYSGKHSLENDQSSRRIVENSTHPGAEKQSTDRHDFKLLRNTSETSELEHTHQRRDPKPFQMAMHKPKEERGKNPMHTQTQHVYNSTPAGQAVSMTTSIAQHDDSHNKKGPIVTPTRAAVKIRMMDIDPMAPAHAED
uniref:CTCK domain-containing protein n=1 Tax=Eptatretus burgeri TaxID=7764 RepID=A0A8C4NB49_EPTBU